jgi:hypothetical protein
MTSNSQTQTRKVSALLVGMNAGRAYDILKIVRDLEGELDKTRRDLHAVRMGRDKAIALLSGGRVAKEHTDMDEAPVTVAIPPRPRPTREDLREIVADELAGMVMKWLEKEAELYTREEIAEKLADILDQEYRWNGANLAAALRDDDWQIDMELAEILDAAEPIFDRLKSEKERAWVSGYRIKPRFTIGDQATYNCRPAIVAGINHERGRYMLDMRPAMGHPQVYLDAPFEDVELETDKAGTNPA